MQQAGAHALTCIPLAACLRYRDDRRQERRRDDEDRSRQRSSREHERDRYRSSRHDDDRGCRDDRPRRRDDEDDRRRDRSSRRDDDAKPAEAPAEQAAAGAGEAAGAEAEAPVIQRKPVVAGKAGGVYIPPFRLAQMMREVSVAAQQRGVCWPGCMCRALQWDPHTIH